MDHPAQKSNPHGATGRAQSPGVSIAVVIPTLNEADSIAATLESIIRQDYPGDSVEVLLVDGGSSDRTIEIASSYKNRGVALRVLQNPRGSTPAAVNLALRSTDADAILWISGHCALSSNYLRESALALAEAGGRATGGCLEVKGEGVRGQLNALVLNSRFGTGISALRFARKEGPTHSITFALFNRETLREIGGLDESLLRNQDNELVARLTAHGVGYWRINATATYLAPKTFTGLWRRAFQNGVWSLWAAMRGRGGYSWWHFAPMIMVGLGTTLALMAIASVPGAALALEVMAAAYLVLAILSALLVAGRSSALWAIPVLPFLFFVHHIIYGLGSWSAVVWRNPVPRRSPNA